MKLISLAAFIASIATGAAILPLNAELVVSVAVVTGVIAIMIQDYKARRPLAIRFTRRSRGGANRTMFRVPALECDPCAFAPWTL